MAFCSCLSFYSKVGLNLFWSAVFGGCWRGGGWWVGVFLLFFWAFLKAAFLGVWFYGHHHIVELFGAFGFEWWCTKEADRSELSLSLCLSVCAEKLPAAL